MKLKIELDGIPPSVNHAYKKRDKGFGMYMTPEAKEFKEYVYYLAKKEISKKEWKILRNDDNFYKMDVDFHFKNKRHPDPNNLLKILIDALENLIFENDKNIDINTNSFIDGEEKTVVYFEI